jgi:hypothetical protein
MQECIHYSGLDGRARVSSAGLPSTAGRIAWSASAAALRETDLADYSVVGNQRSMTGPT